MARRQLAALFFAIAIAIVLPSMAFAAVDGSSAGLVPCGVSSDPLVATECEACNVVELIQGIIMFLIGLSIPLAMVMFAYAGFLYFTSGAGGGNENISKAKRIFTSSVIGFVLALTAWLIVNTVLYTVLNKDIYPNSSWFKIDCSTRPRERNNTVGDVLANHLGIAPAVQVVPPPVFNYTCDEKKGLKLVSIAGGEKVCVDSNNKIVSNATVSSDSKGGSIAAASQAYFGTDTSAGPDGGNKACVWAVNNILNSIGIASIDGNSVANMQDALQNGRGTQVAQGSAQAGDIIIFGTGLSHVGICQNTGCTQVLSNSSSNASFTNTTAPNTGSTFYQVN
ncbi:MAG: pilin [Patescibacteria group bacterium]